MDATGAVSSGSVVSELLRSHRMTRPSPPHRSDDDRGIVRTAGQAHAAESGDSARSASGGRGSDRSGPRFTDGVVALRRLRMSDAEAHLAGEDADLVRWLNGGPGTTETVRRHIEDAERMWNDGGPVYTFAITRVVDDLLVGTIDVQTRQPEYGAGRANLAYGLYPTARGNGYATRAVELALRFLHTLPHVVAAVIRTDPANHPSSAVAKRAGFRRIARASESGDGHDWFELRMS